MFQCMIQNRLNEDKNVILDTYLEKECVTKNGPLTSGQKIGPPYLGKKIPHPDVNNGSFLTQHITVTKQLSRAFNVCIIFHSFKTLWSIKQ